MEQLLASIDNWWIVPLVFVLVMIAEYVSRIKPEKPIEKPLRWYGGCWNPEPKKYKDEKGG